MDTGPTGSAKFLEENKAKEGVVVLPSGLQYKVLTAGSGIYHPKVDAPCECHYAGTLIDGTEFDSSYSRGTPTTFAPNQVIKGWTEAMQLMVEGDKWEMYIPSDMAYGPGGRPPKIPGGAALVFQMEILKIKGDGKVMKADITWTPEQLALWTEADEAKCEEWKQARVKTYEEGGLRDKHPTREGFDAWLAKQCATTKNKTIAVRVKKLESGGAAKAGGLTKETARAFLTKCMDAVKAPASKDTLVAVLKECEAAPADQQQMQKMMKLMPAVQEMLGPTLAEYGFDSGGSDGLMKATMEVQKYSAADPTIAADTMKLMQAVQGDVDALFK